jgi:hypothetical protein
MSETTWQLTVLKDGRCILSTVRPLQRDEVHRVQEVFNEWRDTPHGVLVVADCAVTGRVADVELDLASSGAEARHERLLEDPIVRDLRARQDDPNNCSNCGEPLVTHQECGEFG